MKRNVRKNDGTIARMEYSDICQAIGVSAGFVPAKRLLKLASI